MRVTLKREILWVTTFHKIIEKYGQSFIDWYFRPSITEYGIPEFISFGLKRFRNETFEMEMKELQTKLKSKDRKIISEEDKLLYDHILETALQKSKTKPKTLYEEYALARYEVLKILDNGVTWSVLPEYKRKWKIDQELFGAFFNTSGKFCSLFPELEGCGCQFGTFKPRSKGSKGLKHYLVNPPFEKYYIIWACEKVLEWLRSEGSEGSNRRFKFTLIVPVWDEESRKILKLKPYGPLKALTDVLHSEYVVERSMTQMKFWDGAKKKVQHQKSYIHKIVLEKK